MTRGVRKLFHRICRLSIAIDLTGGDNPAWSEFCKVHPFLTPSQRCLCLSPHPNDSANRCHCHCSEIPTTVSGRVVSHSPVRHCLDPEPEHRFCLGRREFARQKASRLLLLSSRRRISRCPPQLDARLRSNRR